MAETAPLLRDAETDDEISEHLEPTFKDKALNTIHDIVNEPLTPLSKLLLVATLIFLLLGSVRLVTSQNATRGSHIQ